MLEHSAAVDESARHRAHAWRVIFFQPPGGGSLIDVVVIQIQENAPSQENILTK
jgi:hypothetical protein